ncbi:hypothetical protein NU09_0808 [Flavobacterium beibuense]|uniref:Uncharacterized protein n=2 Tax=Flavobacterium beibuense TaxID=657326 RepID=A0A444WHI1_9FLAO|nr:hypothetical protein NU09_0808 [Flavobacterium beibuense]
MWWLTLYNNLKSYEIMKKLITMLVLAIGFTLNAQNTNVTKETKTTTVTVDDGTAEPKKIVKTQKTEAVQDIELKNAQSKALNKDIKPTPVKVTETTTVAGDYTPPTEIGKKISYIYDDRTYTLVADKTGYHIMNPSNKDVGVMRRTSNNSYIYRTKDKISVSYFDTQGNLVIETYDDKSDNITIQRYTRVKQ